MKYKVLLTGNNRTIINEFFTHMDFNFECLNTSDRYDDIMNHLNYVKPDVFVYCLNGESPDALKRFVNVSHEIESRRIPIAIVGNDDECTYFRKMAPYMNAKMLVKPMSSQKIETTIIQLIEKQKGSQGEQSAEDTEAQLLDRILEQIASGESVPTEAASSASVQPAASAPVSPVQASSAESAPAAEAVSKRKHILIVDDDSSVLKLLKGYLGERYDVATAISGKVALKFLEKKKTDLVLLDYEMPGENGTAVLEQIRSNAATKNLPVVFLTGVSSREKIQEVLALKPQGYLLKPIDMERLSSTIKGILH